MMDWSSFALGVGLGFGGASLLWWSLLLAAGRILIARAIAKRQFRHKGQLYIVRRAGEEIIARRNS